jgi:hypothetical protein
MYLPCVINENELIYENFNCSHFVAIVVKFYPILQRHQCYEFSILMKCIILILLVIFIFCQAKATIRILCHLYHPVWHLRSHWPGGFSHASGTRAAASVKKVGKRFLGFELKSLLVLNSEIKRENKGK